jgi:DNA-binding sugar fermentation-stimulating protein
MPLLVSQFQSTNTVPTVRRHTHGHAHDSSMTTLSGSVLCRPRAPAALSLHDSKARKYKHTLEMLQPEPNGAWVGVHSAIANKCVATLLEGRHIPELQGYSDIVPEVALGEHLKAPELDAAVRMLKAISTWLQ